MTIALIVTGIILLFIMFAMLYLPIQPAPVNTQDDEDGAYDRAWRNELEAMQRAKMEEAHLIAEKQFSLYDEGYSDASKGARMNPEYMMDIEYQQGYADGEGDEELAGMGLGG